MSDISQVVGSGSEYYEAMDADGYRARINTPADSQEYYEQFHKPMVDRARIRCGDKPVTVLDIACGPAMELGFFPEDVALLATDISPVILPSVRDLYGSRVNVFASDVEHSPIRDGIADVGLLVNAMIYSPASMLSAMTQALRPGGELAVNFRNFNNPHNAAFYDYYISRGGQMLDRTVRVEQKSGAVDELPVKVLDYTGYTDDAGDTAMRRLGQQMYFTSVDDIGAVATSTGLSVVSHELFDHATVVNPHNQIDVFNLVKASE